MEGDHHGDDGPEEANGHTPAREPGFGQWANAARRVQPMPWAAGLTWPAGTPPCPHIKAATPSRPEFDQAFTLNFEEHFEKEPFTTHTQI